MRPAVSGSATPTQGRERAVKPAVKRSPVRVARRGKTLSGLKHTSSCYRSCGQRKGSRKPKGKGLRRNILLESTALNTPNPHHPPPPPAPRRKRRRNIGGLGSLDDPQPVERIAIPLPKRAPMTPLPKR